MPCSAQKSLTRGNKLKVRSTNKHADGFYKSATAYRKCSWPTATKYLNGREEFARSLQIWYHDNDYQLHAKLGTLECYYTH